MKGSAVCGTGAGDLAVSPLFICHERMASDPVPRLTGVPVAFTHDLLLIE